MSAMLSGPMAGPIVAGTAAAVDSGKRIGGSLLQVLLESTVRHEHNTTPLSFTKMDIGAGAAQMEASLSFV